MRPFLVCSALIAINALAVNFAQAADDPTAPLVSKLKGSDPSARLAAVKSLAALGASAMPALPELVRAIQAETFNLTVAEMDRPPTRMFQTVGFAIGGGNDPKETPEQKKKREEEMKQMKEAEEKRLAEWRKAVKEWQAKNLAAQQTRVEFLQAALEAVDKIDPKAAEQQLGLGEARRNRVNEMLAQFDAMNKSQAQPAVK